MIQLYDTARRKKVALEAHNKDQVGIYICGPTVYDKCHVGHARCYVAFDVVVRHLRNRGYRVTYVRNLTDVDDKIINRAIAPWSLGPAHSQQAKTLSFLKTFS